MAGEPPHPQRALSMVSPSPAASKFKRRAPYRLESVKGAQIKLFAAGSAAIPIWAASRPASALSAARPRNTWCPLKITWTATRSPISAPAPGPTWKRPWTWRLGTPPFICAPPIARRIPSSKAMFKALWRTEAEHASLICKLLKVPKPEIKPDDQGLPEGPQGQLRRGAGA